MMLAQARENITLIYNEAFGEKTDHPLITRFLAFIVDYIIFLVSGLIIFFALEGIGKQSTGNQLVVDIAIWTVYFTFGNSKFFHGQTLGKKLARIRVVDSDGNYLGLMKSFIRSVPIVLLMNSYQILYYIHVTEKDDWYIFAFYGLTAILFGSIYFPLLKPTRQGLHGMIVFSQVIPKNRTITIERKFNWVLIIVFILIMTTYTYLMLS